MKLFRYTLSLFIFVFVCFALSFGQRDKSAMNYELAKQYMSEEKYTEAASLLEDEISKNFNGDYYKLLKEAYTLLQDNDKQEKLIKKALKKTNNNFRYAIDLGTFYINTDRKTKGIKQYENVLNNLPENNSEIVQTANYFSLNRNYDYAAKVYLQGRKIFKDPTKYTYELTYIYQLLGQNEKIAEEYLLLLKKSPNSLNQIEVNINNLFNRDKDEKLYETFSEVVLDEVKSSPQNKEINVLYYWLLNKKEDYAAAFIQAKAIDKRFKSENNEYVNEFASTAMNNGQYKYALQAFDFILKNSENTDNLLQIRQNRLTCLYKQFTLTANQTDKSKKDLQKEYEQFFTSFGHTPQTVTTIQQYADLLAYYLQEPEKAVEELDTIINMKAVGNLQKAESKLTRADIYLINGDVWEASLMYSQVDKDFKNETIGSEAKFRLARLSYFTGDFDWAVSRFDALKSSTTKLISNDAMEYSLLIKENMDEDSTYKGLNWLAKADFCLYQNKAAEAEKYLDSIETWFLSHPLFDDILLRKAQIAISKEDYHKADSLLLDIVTKYPYDLTADDALMLLAQINEEYFKDTAKAKEYYEKIILDYSSSLYISTARKKYKEL